jgi:ABC-type lipoprotein release transport system permease subunit
MNAPLFFAILFAGLAVITAAIIVIGALRDKDAAEARHRFARIDAHLGINSQRAPDWDTPARRALEEEPT